MNMVNDKDIENLIKNNKFSMLSFLDSEWSSSKNPYYIGFYYFTLQLKQESTETVFKEIVLRQSSESNAYLYLAKIANNIFTSLSKNYIALKLYRKAIEADAQNSDAHWSYYYLTNNFDSLLASLNIDYKKGNFEHIKRKLQFIYINTSKKLNFPKDNWLLIKKIYAEIEISPKKELLILAHYYLEEFDRGIEVIKSSNKVSYEVIKRYFDKNLISADLVLSKIHIWEKDRFLENDHRAIYKEYLDEAKLGQPNPTKEVLIKKAFLAEEYEDVLNYVNNTSQSESFLLTLEVFIYYLIAQLLLNQSLNLKKLTYINEQIDDFNSTFGETPDTKPLYYTLKFKLKIKELESMFLNEEYVTHSIEIHSPYQKAEKILDKAELIKFYLYDDLKRELDDLRDKWNQAHYKRQFDDLRVSYINENFDYTQFWNLCSYGITCKEYDYVLKILDDFHTKQSPTMRSYNCLGVCHESKGDNTTAFKYYKNAIDLMYTSKDSDYAVINNFVSCAKEVNHPITDDEIKILKDEFNNSLVNSFKWNSYSSAHSTILYKYSPFNINTIDSIANQYFYLAEKKQLNDPIELPELAKLSTDPLIHTNYRICSFSTNDNSMLMWSHYAEQHQGIIVEYHFHGELPKGVGISRVSYTEDIKRQKEKDLYIFNQFLLTKNKEWSYENEVRLFSYLSDKVNYESYDYPNGDISKINARIRSITLGYKFPENKKKLISSLIRSLNSSIPELEDHILLKEAYICDENNFSLKYKEVELYK